VAVIGGAVVCAPAGPLALNVSARTPNKAPAIGKRDPKRLIMIVPRNAGRALIS
jgi:hypothetical protein